MKPQRTWQHVLQQDLRFPIIKQNEDTNYEDLEGNIENATYLNTWPLVVLLERGPGWCMKCTRTSGEQRMMRPTLEMKDGRRIGGEGYGNVTKRKEKKKKKEEEEKSGGGRGREVLPPPQLANVWRDQGVKGGGKIHKDRDGECYVQSLLGSKSC